MNALQEAFVPLLTLLVGIVISGLVFVVKTEISERRRQSRDANYSLRLEEHRDALARITGQLSAVQATANAALLEGQRASAERRANAVDALWREVLRIRNESPAAVGMLDILLPSEYQNFVTNDRFRSLVPELEETVATLVDHEIEHVRPFLGERVFTLFFIYRAVHGRICFLLDRGVKAGKVTPWFDDAGVHQLLLTILTESEIQALTELTLGRVRWMSSLIEGKILEQLWGVIVGEVSSSEGLEQARRVQEIMRDVELDDKRPANP